MVNFRDSLVHGIEKPIILWLLYSNPRHGYELINEFKKLTGQKLKPGMVYPFLHWLEDEGFAASEWMKQSGRNLRCYHLTNTGKQMFRKLRNFFTKPVKEIIIDLLGEEKVD